MSKKRFSMKGSTILENGKEITAWDCYELLNEQQATIEQQEKIIKEQTLRTYCQDKEIQKLLQQIKELKET